MLAGGDLDITVQLWDAAMEELDATLTGHTELVSHTAYPISVDILPSPKELRACQGFQWINLV